MKVVFCKLLGMVFMYTVNLCCSHWLIINLFWPMTMQDKVVLKTQTRDSEEEGWSWRRCHKLSEKEATRA